MKYARNIGKYLFKLAECVNYWSRYRTIRFSSVLKNFDCLTLNESTIKSFF